MLADTIEWRLAKRVDHVMTYAPSGRDYLITRGHVPAERITAIGNSTDTAALRSQLMSIQPQRGAELRAQFGAGPVALFVGGLDASKRVDFLLKAFMEARRLNPDFRLIVAGRGELEADVRRLAAADSHLEYLPGATGQRLAELAYVSDVVWMPGRVGLVAVDALALGLSLHTTNFEFHAPEIEFLRPGEVAYLPDDPRKYASESLELIGTHPRTKQFRDDIPSVQAVARSMFAVISATLGAED
jgi:glycosyltransferase involved in cell wall biosynthesis